MGDIPQASARIGMLVPSGNIVAEDEVRSMLPPVVALHVTRMPLTDSSDRALNLLVERAPDAARLLADARVDLIAFNCTAVSTRSPGADREICLNITNACNGTPAVATSQALLSALKTLKAKRIVLVTPYIAPVVEREAAFFTHHGIDVLSSSGAGIDSNWDMAREPDCRWRALTLESRSAEADAYVLSCTAIRTGGLIEGLENEMGRPVLTSNQAIAWHAMRQAGVDASVEGFGTLLARC